MGSFAGNRLHDASRRKLGGRCFAVREGQRPRFCVSDRYRMAETASPIPCVTRIEHGPTATLIEYAAIICHPCADGIRAQPFPPWRLR